MSDPYLDKLDAQRSVWRDEMAWCPLCAKNKDSKTPIVDHIWGHRMSAHLTLAVDDNDVRFAPQSDADIEYDHDAPSDHYPYKSRGMDDAASMHPSRWREPSEAMPGNYKKGKGK